MNKSIKRKLLIGSALVTIASACLLLLMLAQVAATPEEQMASLPGDEFVTHPIGIANHAITFQGTPHDVWPWLVQMGSGRAGWYAYDSIDNGGHPSAQRIIPEFQVVKVGDVFPALPGQTQVFSLMRVDPEKDLVLGWRQPDGKVQTSWAFVLSQPRAGETRIVVRGRIADGYKPLGLPQFVAVLVAEPAHFVMERKQLLNLAWRVKHSHPQKH